MEDVEDTNSYGFLNENRTIKQKTPKPRKKIYRKNKPLRKINLNRALMKSV
jgi:hypothetical protein